MVSIIKEELHIEESLRKKLELICEFAKADLKNPSSFNPIGIFRLTKPLS